MPSRAVGVRRDRVRTTKAMRKFAASLTERVSALDPDFLVAPERT